MTDPADPAVAGFADLVARTFPDPTLVIPAYVVSHMLRRRERGRRNRLLVLLRDAEVVGATFFHYFPRPNTAFSSYMVLAPEHRGQGLARLLFAARLQVLDREAAGCGHGGVAGLFIDVADPRRMDPQLVARERRLAMDPVRRRRIFHHMGFRRVDVPYYQPPGPPRWRKVTYLDLLFLPCRPDWQEELPLAAVRQTLRAYWAPWLGVAAAARHAAAIAGGRSRRGARLQPATVE